MANRVDAMLMEPYNPLPIHETEEEEMSLVQIDWERCKLKRGPLPPNDPRFSLYCAFLRGSLMVNPETGLFVTDMMSFK